MSVLKSKRTLSKHEYVHTFEILYKFTMEKLYKVAKRKFKFICEPIANKMNHIYKEIMQANNNYCNYGIKLIDKKSQAECIINELVDLQKPLLALWNIEKYDTRIMANWCNLIEEEIKYITNLGSLKSGEIMHMFILDYKAVNEADFIKVMCELHKLIYTKTISLNEKIRSTKGNLLIELVDEALFRICHANRFVPTCKKMYENREKDLSIALDCLKQMQQPMMSLFNLMNYSEAVMIEMSSKLDREMKLLKGVIKSDKKRFSNLL